MNATKTAWSTDADRWTAVTERDARADGEFFFAVRTTGVFCRPSCASRQPRRENVEFFVTVDEARAAGYRDCKRCQPGGLPRELEIVNRACAALDADPQQRLTLAQLSDAVHVSPFHLQRLFKRVVGVSPREYQAAQRGAALRDALQRGANVTRATVDAGFGSPSRMYDNAPEDLKRFAYDVLAALFRESLDADKAAGTASKSFDEMFPAPSGLDAFRADLAEKLADQKRKQSLTAPK